MKKYLPLLFLFFVSLNTLGQIPTAGMVIGYPFIGNAADSSGYNNNGIVSGAVLTAGKLGVPNTAYYFNGSSYIRVPHATVLDTLNHFTIMAVFKPMGFYIGNCYGNAIVDKGSPDYLSGNYALRFNAAAYGNFSCSYFDTLHQNFQGLSYGQPYPPSAFPPYITYGTWYCVAYTVGTDSSRIYIDGVQKWSAHRGGSIGSNTQDLYIGHKNASGFPYWFHGVMDDVRIYNRELSFDEINKYCVIFTEGPNGISANDSSGFIIYPNPARDKLTINLSKSVRLAQVELFNLPGQKVFSSALTQLETELQLPVLAHGLYILRLTREEGVYSQKLIID
jgi:hypothetical protein